MKTKINFTLLILAATFILSSCVSSTDDNKPILSTFGTVTSGGSSGMTFIRLDFNDGYALPTNMSSQLNIDDRVYIDFVINEDKGKGSHYRYDITLLTCKKLDIKNIDISSIPEPTDTLTTNFFINNDKKKMLVWLEQDLDLLNVHYHYLNNKENKHIVTLTCYNSAEIIGGADTINLKLRHDTQGERYLYQIESDAVSFRLSNIQHASRDSVVLAVEIPYITDTYPPLDVKKKIEYITYKYR